MYDSGMKLRRAANDMGVTLGQVIGRGGEGVVHAVSGWPGLVAKIYKKPPAPGKTDKLRAMVRHHSEQLLSVAAWPQDLLLDERGVVRGFLMGRITTRQDAHRLYSPKSRRRTFPDADFRFVVRAATNLARAFAWVHADGHVIGDVNHGNALIGRDGTAVLIDCDSFQISDRGRILPCDVGSPLFTPPELQGKVFRGLRREETHDCFGLAVLLFHLLFQGRHPFAGRYLAGDLSVEQAIAESRFVYGARRSEFGMTPPPGTLQLDTFGSDLAQLFERAFAPPGNRMRPSAAEWIEPLQRLEKSLLGCRARPRHFHPPGPACCWCSVERITGAQLFDPLETSGVEAEGLTPEQIWKDIQRIPAPSAYARMPALGHARSPADTFDVVERNFGVASLVFIACLGVAKSSPALAGVGFAAGLVFAIVTYAFLSQRAGIRLAFRREWNLALEQWKTSSSAADFYQLKAGLRKRLDDLTRIERARSLELEKLRRHHLPRQRDAYLDSFEVARAQFERVSNRDIGILQARGIRSAGDVLRQRQQPDVILDPAWKELKAWADRCRSAYAFDAQDPAFATLVDPVESRARDQRREVLNALMVGRAALQQRRTEIEKARREADATLQAKFRRLET